MRAASNATQPPVCCPPVEGSVLGTGVGAGVNARSTLWGEGTTEAYWRSQISLAVGVAAAAAALLAARAPGAPPAIASAAAAQGVKKRGGKGAGEPGPAAGMLTGGGCSSTWALVPWKAKLLMPLAGRVALIGAEEV